MRSKESHKIERTPKILNIHVFIDASFYDDSKNNWYNFMTNEDSPNPESGLINNPIRTELERSITAL
jgi:RNA polymerase primary sigma factor